jgi:SAM-dependent methyltransferase
MGSWQQEYIARYYRRQPGWKELRVQWRELLQGNIPGSAEVLEVGPGPSGGRYLSSMSLHLVGLDIDPEVKQNPWLDEVHVYDGQRFPFPDNRFDVVVSSWVNEHIENPEVHCKEIHRVLIPGGKYIFRTPNLYHYTSIGAYITPHWFHVLVANRLRNFPPDCHDPYPTYYRLNTRQQIRSLLRKIGFTLEALEVKETYPVYGQASRVMFYAFMIYERIVNSSPLLEDLCYTIHGVARKDAQSH